MTIPRIISTSALTLALLTGAACSGSDGTTGTAPAGDDAALDADANASADTADSGTPTVGISKSRFEPTEISIAVGETVAFTNNDPFAHTVTAREDAGIQFDSGSLGQDETFEVEFADAGTYAYFCEIHPTMRATVVVG